MSSVDLLALSAAVDAAKAVVDACARHLASQAARTDEAIQANQTIAYDLAHAASAVENARAVIDYGNKGDTEALLAAAFVADVAFDVATKIYAREEQWGVTTGAMDGALGVIRSYRSPEFLASVAAAVLPANGGPRHLDPDFEMVQDTFRRFADEQIRTRAEHVHRHNADVPEEVIAGLAEMGGFGLSVPEEYGGFATGGEGEYLGDPHPSAGAWRDR
jgi:(2S)-methylsuccinyl-CoA dehydrogenase